MKKATMGTKGKGGLSPITTPQAMLVVKVLVTAAALLATTRVVLAGHFEPIKGKGVGVCDEYFSYLSTVRYGDTLTCDREFPSDLTELKRPAWQQLDPKQNRLLVLHIENYLQMPRDEKATHPWVPVHREDALDNFYIADCARLATAQLDIDNDSKPETVAKFRDFRCDTWGQSPSPRGPMWVAPLVVLDAGKQDVDREKTYPLMQNPGKVFASNAKEIQEYFEAHKSEPDIVKNRPKTIWKESKYAPGAALLMGYDAFFFKHQTYFDKWDEQEGQKGIHILSIYHTQGSKTNEVCRYRWHD